MTSPKTFNEEVASLELCKRLYSHYVVTKDGRVFSDYYGDWRELKQDTLRGYKKNGMAKLTEENVKYIRRSMWSNEVLAKHFKVSNQAISDIRLGKRWKHV